jgi:hypothetical protein
MDWQPHSVSLLFYICPSSLFFYDLPPFLATLVLVFLLADASPFLLDFFLVAIYLDLFYVHTIINDLLLFFHKILSKYHPSMRDISIVA